MPKKSGDGADHSPSVDSSEKVDWGSISAEDWEYAGGFQNGHWRRVSRTEKEKIDRGPNPLTKDEVGHPVYSASDALGSRSTFKALSNLIDKKPEYGVLNNPSATTLFYIDPYRSRFLDVFVKRFPTKERQKFMDDLLVEMDVLLKKRSTVDRAVTPTARRMKQQDSQGGQRVSKNRHQNR